LSVRRVSGWTTLTSGQGLDLAGLTVKRDGELVAWVTFHTFRHTCASLLFEAGRNVSQVAEWLGHADPAYTLRRYVHLLDAGLGDADFLDAELGDGGNRVATGGPQIAADRALAGRA
jgi:integrase